MKVPVILSFSYPYGLSLLFLITITIAAVVAGVYFIHQRCSHIPETSIEVFAKRVLSNPDKVAYSVANEITANAPEKLVFYDEVLPVNSDELIAVSFSCPIGVKLYVSFEPDTVYLSRFLVNSTGLCVIEFTIPDAEVVHVTVYSYREDLLRDDAFRTYLVFTWANENLRYISDPNKTDIYFSPADVVRRGGGDCEDLAITIASILRAMGIDAGIALVRTGLIGWSIADHAAVVVKPSSKSFILNLRLYFDAIFVKCQPVVVDSYIVLDPVLRASSKTPWCLSYDNNSIYSIITANNRVVLQKI